MSAMEHQPGQKEPNRKRKCGPRVKTGCITCRIRRVKCDEAKPACYKCTSTGRKCDGYVQRTPEKALTVTKADSSFDFAAPLSVVYAMPFALPGSERDRQLFHYYCVQSAFDLSVYLNSAFWHNTILQYSAHHAVVRQAVIAVGASHVYALNMNQKHRAVDASSESYEQAMQYDKALRALRTYIESNDKPDPHVILICCALFFSSENGRGDREAALQHLQNGLRILSMTKQKQKQIANQPNTFQSDGSKMDITAAYEGSMNQIRSKDAEVDDELLYALSRLDCQATLCEEDRVPVLDLEAFDEPLAGQNTRFPNITNAQRRLDALQNRLARFLTTSKEFKASPAEELPVWLLERKAELDRACLSWSDAMNNFIAVQSPAVRKTLALEKAGPERKDPEWKLAIQIQLLILHHRCWWMLFLSSYPDDPSVFTRSPNPRAEEILDICEFLGFSLPLRPSVTPTMSEADVTWKLISEIGVAAPLFVLATKCLDTNVRDRAMKQLTALREYRSGVYDQMFLSRLVDSIGLVSNADDFGMTGTSTTSSFDSPDQSTSSGLDELYRTPHSDSGSSQGTGATTVDVLQQEGQPRELLGWSRKLSTI